MPLSSPRPCANPSCRALTTSGAYCDKHKKQKRKHHDSQRGSSTQRGYNYKWQKASKAYREKHPLCECQDCRAGELRIMPSEVVDHIIPHQGDMKLFWDRKNWQAMSKQCHDRKTAKEDGGFTGKTGSNKGGGGQKSTAFYL